MPHDNHIIEVEKALAASDAALSVSIDEGVIGVGISTFHEQRAALLVVDPEEARIEFGEAVGSMLKLPRDGTKVLWPYPMDSDRDPQNWSDMRETVHLIIITLAAIVPDFDSGIGKEHVRISWLHSHFRLRGYHVSVPTGGTIRYDYRPGASFSLDGEGSVLWW